MMEIHASKQVNAPIDVTFAVFSDISKAQERVAGITKVELLSDITQGMGTRWRETRKLFGKEATEEMEITAFHPNKSYEVIAESHGTKYHSRFTFTEQQGGTLVEMVFTATPISLPSRLISIFGFLFAGASRKAFEADMSDLKAVAEQQLA